MQLWFNIALVYLFFRITISKLLGIEEIRRQTLRPEEQTMQRIFVPYAFALSQ